MTVQGPAGSTETIEYEGLKLTFDGPLATLTLNDPKRLNALTPTMANGVADALLELSKPRRRVRGLLLTGEGRAFCAGANLAAEAGSAGKGGKRHALTSLESAYHPMLRRLRALPIPLVAAVHGPCVGIGLAMALAADHLVASDAAYFLVPFRNLASAPDSGLTWLLPRLVGVKRAQRMILQAERVPADRALEWGLVSQLVSQDDFAVQSHAAAMGFAKGPTVALSEMKKLIAGSATWGLDEAMEAEALAVATTSRTKDNLAAIRVFGTKDKPVFTGE